jgi:hypothetical protein
MNTHSKKGFSQFIAPINVFTAFTGYRTSYILALLFLSFSFPHSVSAQEGEQVSVPASPLKMQYRVNAEIYNGDTIPSIRFQDVYVYADYVYKNKKQYEVWTRTKYNVKKVYPYAILAAAKLKEYNAIMEKMDEKTRKAYMKVVERQLKDEFEEPLKNLSMTQGKILLKLIDRETGNTSYTLVKDLRGDFQAFMWQSLARLFGSNMKDEYDPTGEDIMIERAIKLIEAGQF